MAKVVPTVMAITEPIPSWKLLPPVLIPVAPYTPSSPLLISSPATMIALFPLHLFSVQTATPTICGPTTPLRHTWQAASVPQAVQTALPFGVRRIHAFRTLTTESLAACMPFRTQEIMEPGGIYFGEHTTVEENGEKKAIDILSYTESEIERIGRIGFETARKRSGKLCSVEKSNVLDSSRLWRKVMHRLAEEYPDVTLSDMLVDNCAMQIVKDPSQFDVVVTENMFGDILSDEASMITGSIGMIPSSSLGSSTCGLYEPIHGSAPDIAGKDLANPIGTVLSAAMMLRYSFDMTAEADCIENAVSAVLDAGYRTGDIMPSDGEAAAKCIRIGCAGMGQQIVNNLKKE